MSLLQVEFYGLPTDRIGNHVERISLGDLNQLVIRQVEIRLVDPED